MSHKADSSFFKEKRHWSKRKDEILRSYLTAYLPKIATQRKPILVVDAFAGPGVFGDGELGSPLIIASVIQEALTRTRPLAVQVRHWALETDSELCSILKKNLSVFQFSEVRQSTFLSQVDRIREAAKSSSVFLYLDPFTVEGLEWNALDQLFSTLKTGNSIEILLNLNIPSFVRRGSAAMKLAIPEKNSAIEDVDEPDVEDMEPPSLTRLDTMAGGTWWREVIAKPLEFAAKVSLAAEKFRSMMASRFNEVCIHEVKALPNHTVPKYYLVFGSRHPHALRLMNDEMVKSRDVLAGFAKPKEPTLFETRPISLVPDESELPKFVIDASRFVQTRGRTIESIIRKHFCMFSSAQIRTCVEQLLKQGLLESSTKHWKINDDVKIGPPGAFGGKS